MRKKGNFIFINSLPTTTLAQIGKRIAWIKGKIILRDFIFKKGIRKSDFLKEFTWKGYWKFIKKYWK